MTEYVVIYYPHHQHSVGGPAKVVDAVNPEHALEQVLEDDEYALCEEVDFEIGNFIVRPLMLGPNGESEFSAFSAQEHKPDYVRTNEQRRQEAQQ